MRVVREVNQMTHRIAPGVRRDRDYLAFHVGHGRRVARTSSLCSLKNGFPCRGNRSGFHVLVRR